ncbi:hypothetical protein GCK72_018918 [Caenorhabditis remanei]|uniref:Uncharacterized protein n=1 Tax=Caenorhabditis remanei TaxID=31234 RepID=A0A6A5GCD8_CAERE|nr:hypothetical protein GCK72_018918 [Caenorhabditis remanei]KAF1752364.1 hypothetical protein GCK72_018918 [Caenorhabditis remanei]
MASPAPSNIYVQREVAREEKLKAEKKAIEEKHNETYSALRAKQEKEMEVERMQSQALAEEKKKELIELRTKQAKELAELDAQIDKNLKEQIELRKTEGREEVLKRKQDLEKKQKELEELAAIRRSQLHDSSEILRNGEKLRQECMTRLREDRKKEQEAMNAKKLEMNQKLHEVRIAGEERLQNLDELRIEEQKQQLLKKERIILNGITNSEALSRSLGIEDSFELFKQQCKSLRNRHRGFCNEYDTIEPELLKMHERMKKGKELGDCDMDNLLSALRVFREQATMFSAEGSTDEINFQARIGDLIELIRLLMAELNSIKATIEEYEDNEEGCNDGIAESLVKISDEMQKFNVIGRDHLQETLAIQMKQAHSSRHQAIESGERPPAYSGKKVPVAITDN